MARASAVYAFSLTSRALIAGCILCSMANLTRGPRGRYAPTPSGVLHLGNLRTALLAWLWTRRHGGQFVLRIEDLDRPRVQPGAIDVILKDLAWLGLDWDEGPDGGGLCGPYVQSERLVHYRTHLARLQSAGLVYPCYCSRRDIAEAASAPHRTTGQMAGGPSRYPGTCRDPERREVARRRAGDRPPALRFQVNDELMVFNDQIRGRLEMNLQHVGGDFVVWKGDGTPAYQLAVVVDDALMQIDDVVRGDDLLESTPRQIVLYRALGYPVPRFAHVPLLVDAAGERLAKRTGAAGLEPLRARGMRSEDVVGQMAFSAGLIPSPESLSAHALIAMADWDSLQTRPTVINF